MNKQVLLFNTSKSEYPPMALMKYSTYYKKLGYNVYYETKTNMFPEYHPDLILISTVFTWEYNQTIRDTLYLRKQFPDAKIFIGGICASLLQKDFENELKDFNIKIMFGIQPEIDNQELDYSLSNKDYSIGYTTRGCPRKCGWCMVWRIEKEYKELPKQEWVKFIRHKRMLFYDNNISNASIKHFKSVIDYMKENNISFDFNQAMDCRLLTDEHFKILQNSKIAPFRIAFDSMQSNGHIQRTMGKATKYGLTDGSVYMLYNFNETLEEWYFRMKEVIRFYNFDVYPMKYQLLNCKEKDLFIGKHWSELSLYNFKTLLHTFFSNSMIGRGLKMDRFETIFGHNKDEFKKIITHPDIKEYSKTISIGKKRKIKSEGLLQLDETQINNLIKDSDGFLSRGDAINILRKDLNDKEIEFETERRNNEEVETDIPDRPTKDKRESRNRGLDRFF